MSLLARKKTSLIVLLVMLCLLTFVVAACSGDTAATPTATSTSKLGVQTGPGGPTGPYTDPQTALLTWNAQTQQLTVTIHLTGLVPSSVHPDHIHVGTCASGGGIKYPLKDLHVDSSGNVLETTVIPGISTGILASGWHIMVHHGPGLLTAAEAAPIDCGDVSNTKHSTTVKVTLMSMK